MSGRGVVMVAEKSGLAGVTRGKLISFFFRFCPHEPGLLSFESFSYDLPHPTLT